MAICINAWHELSTCRPIGMAVGAIPVTAILAWCEAEEFDREATRIMKHVIRQLDNDHAEREAAAHIRGRIMGGG